MTLNEILELVGPLDDSAGDNTARERFRAHLAKSVTTAGGLRDDIEMCLRAPSQEHERALQDLVNHCGRLLGQPWESRCRWAISSVERAASEVYKNNKKNLKRFGMQFDGTEFRGFGWMISDDERDDS